MQMAVAACGPWYRGMSWLAIACAAWFRLAQKSLAGVLEGGWHIHSGVQGELSLDMPQSSSAALGQSGTPWVHLGLTFQVPMPLALGCCHLTLAQLPRMLPDRFLESCALERSHSSRAGTTERWRQKAGPLQSAVALRRSLRIGGRPSQPKESGP